MKRLLPAALIACGSLLVWSEATHATLNCTITVDGTQIAVCPTNNTGDLNFSGADAPLFSSFSLTANGSPILPQPDLSSVTLDVTAASTFTGTHVLGVDIFQTNVSSPSGTTLETTATINNLIGVPGPTTLSDFVNGTSSTLGTTLRSNTFPATFTGAVGPFDDTIGVPITADAHQFLITFSAPDQSANDTIQTQGVVAVAEPRSLAMLGSALMMMGFLGWRRRQHH